jgi:hypothetical protein
VLATGAFTGLSFHYKHVVQPRAFARTGLCCPCRQRSDAPIRRRAGSVRLLVVPVIRIGCSSAGDRSTRAGDGLPSSRAYCVTIPFPLPRGVPRCLHVQVFSALGGLAVISAARHSLVPLRGWPHGAPGLPWCCGLVTCFPPGGAFDAGLRHRAFPPDAASLLPGLLAATRTGLSLASRHELVDVGHLKCIDSFRR